MKKRKKTRVYNPKQRNNTIKVPESTKQKLTELAIQLIDSDLRPSHVKRRRKNERFSYIADIYTKWYRNYFYFCAKYNCPEPDSMVPEFESKFARLEYLLGGKYNLSYMRHNDKWWETEKNLSQIKAFEEIKEGGLYQP